MTSLRILLVEDNPASALDVEVLLSELGYDLVATFDNGEDALENIHADQPDLIIMDIQLKGKLSGLDVAKAIAPFQIPIIFTTFFKDKTTYEAATKANSFGYLVKPFDKLTLQNMIEMAVRSLYGDEMLDEKDTGWSEDFLLQDRFLVKTSGILQKVMLRDILYLKGEGNYTMLMTKDKKFVVKVSLRKMLEKFPLNQFAPIHKSFIVQLDKVDAVDASFNQVIVGSENLPLGRHFKNGFLDRFQMLK